jgi:hypothetical protein
MSYLTKKMSTKAIIDMAGFHSDVVSCYSKYGMDLLDNLGRRNIVMSQAQEKFFSSSLSSSYDNVSNDGRTGQPDIIIGSLQKELECKLTSKHKSGTISFQTDYETLLQKKSLDYLYVVADRDFNSFAVLHFEGLTVNDFRSPSPGSRGKVAMIKHKAMGKCNILMGDVIDRNIIEIEKIKRKMANLSDRAVKTREKLESSLSYWNETPTKYSISLEEVSLHAA